MAMIKLTKIVRSIFPEVDRLFRERVSQQMTLMILKQKAEKVQTKAIDIFES